MLADDPDAGKTIMAGLYMRELLLRADPQRILVVAPSSLVEQWRAELRQKIWPQLSRPSLREVNYQRALESELAHAGLGYRPQQVIAVYDRLNDRQLLGYYIPDFIVEGKVVVEITALGRLDNAHVAQVISYLAITDCGVGLLINFGERKLNWRRIFPPTDLEAYRVNKHWLWNPAADLAADKFPANGFPANGFLQTD